MRIPIDEIAPQTLFNLVSSFVLREGTDYGLDEASLSDKVAQVISQLKSGEAILLYSELHESVNIISRQAYAELTSQGPAEQD